MIQILPWHTLFLPLSILALVGRASAADVIHITGDAYDVDQQQLRYREEHLINDTEHSVRYTDPDGKLIAEKQISYNSGFITPVYRLYDQRFSRETGSLQRDRQWFAYRYDKSGHQSELLLESADKLVIDLGFNNYIRSHFDELDSGEPLHFYFGLSDPLVELPMHLQRISCDTHQLHEDDGRSLCMRAKTTNLLYRWFVPTIYVVYDRNTRFLMHYEGPSNLPGDDDKAQHVRINYSYEVFPLRDIP